MGTISCPHCDNLLEANSDVVGKSVTCGLCHKRFVVPNDDSADTNEIPLLVLLAILVGGHVVGLLLLALMIGLAPSSVVLILIILTEIIIWQLKKHLTMV